MEERHSMEEKHSRISIIGGGSWGIALAVLLHKNGHEITVWSALETEIQMLRETHEHKMLPGVTLPEDILFTADDKEAVTGKDLLAYGMKPGKQIGETLSGLLDYVLSHPEENQKEQLLKLVKDRY